MVVIAWFLYVGGVGVRWWGAGVGGERASPHDVLPCGGVWDEMDATKSTDTWRVLILGSPGGRGMSCWLLLVSIT